MIGELAEIFDIPFFSSSFTMYCRFILVGRLSFLLFCLGFLLREK